jgi:hypothetical protein
MAKPLLHRNTFRNTSNVQTTSQLILQGSISRIAEDEERKRALRRVVDANSKLAKLEAAQCLVSPKQMDNVLKNILGMVERAEVRARCPELPVGLGHWDDVT